MHYNRAELGSGLNHYHQTQRIITDLINNMKKVTMSVAALTIAISGFCNPPTDGEIVKELSMTTEDIIQSMRVNDYSDTVRTKQMSEIYIHNLLDMLSKLEDLQMKQSQEEYYNSLNCNNCDEID